MFVVLFSENTNKNTSQTFLVPTLFASLRLTTLPCRGELRQSIFLIFFFRTAQNEFRFNKSFIMEITRAFRVDVDEPTPHSILHRVLPLHAIYMSLAFGDSIIGKRKWNCKFGSGSGACVPPAAPHSTSRELGHVMLHYPLPVDVLTVYKALGNVLYWFLITILLYFKLFNSHTRLWFI